MTDASFKYSLTIRKVTMDYYNGRWHATLYADKTQIDRALKRLRTLPHRVHKSTHGCKAYFVHDTYTGLANFLWHDPHREYSARRYNLRLVDGTFAQVVNTSTMRASVINKWFTPRVIMIRLAINDPSLLHMTHMDVKTLAYWIKVWAPEFRIGRAPDRSEWGYRIYKRVD